MCVAVGVKILNKILKASIQEYTLKKIHWDKIEFFISVKQEWLILEKSITEMFHNTHQRGNNLLAHTKKKKKHLKNLTVHLDFKRKKSW